MISCVWHCERFAKQQVEDYIYMHVVGVCHAVRACT